LDLRDCKEILDDGEGITTLNQYGEKISDMEIDNAIELIEMCREITANFENESLNDIREAWDNLKEHDDED
jgi:hypothetical protein